MARYRYDMSKEGNGAETFDEGWYTWEVVSMEEQTSKNGNKMFKISLVVADDPTRGLVLYAVAEQGKRWYLKNLLDAVGCPAGKDGVYDFDTDEIVGKRVKGRIQNQQESWKDKEGNIRESTKSKITEFVAVGVAVAAEEDDPFAQ